MNALWGKVRIVAISILHAVAFAIFANVVLALTVERRVLDTTDLRRSGRTHHNQEKHRRCRRSEVAV